MHKNEHTLSADRGADTKTISPSNSLYTLEALPIVWILLSALSYASINTIALLCVQSRMMALGDND